ncbi:MAG: hypothetical protein ACKVPJ_08220 [Chitinophagales bacterium]
MKKFYTSIAIVAVIVMHVSARLVVADSFTFSSSEYDHQSNQIAEPNDPVSYTSYTMPAKTLSINYIPSDNSFMNY